MKKCAILLAVAAVAASCLAEGSAELENTDAEKEQEARIIGGFYGEGSNSSFIVRKELTATQKRFLAVGRNFLELVAYTKKLEWRVAALEARLKAIDDEAEGRRKAREIIAEERRRKAALRRAQERGKRIRGAVK